MGLRGFFEALTKIATQPDKDFGELVRQRRRKRGLPVAPAEKVLPFPPPHSDDGPAEREVVDTAAEAVLAGDSRADELRTAAVRLAERRMREALLALEDAGLHEKSRQEVARLEQIYARELAAYSAKLTLRDDTSASG
jgi:hypothetical protein